MILYPPTVVLRHRKENLKKCSLRGLEVRSDFKFYTYPADAQSLPDLSGYILLHLEAPPLSPSDAEHGLFVIDSTWRLAETIFKNTKGLDNLIYRSIPSNYRTAYPRRQEDCFDPSRGLASIEAIYLSYLLLGRDINGLLDNYYWKEMFLQINNLKHG